MIRLWKQDGTEIDITQYGLRGLRLIIPSPSYSITKEEIPGRIGAVPLGKDLSPKKLTAEFLVTAVDYQDSLLLRDELYQLFSNPFYIGEEYQRGKRWEVECTEPWNPDRINHINSIISLPLLCEKGVAESVGTTLDPFTFDMEIWQVGQGLTADDMKYVHTSALFNIYNAGNVTVDPRYLDLLIEYKGASTNLTIKNETTGDEWAYTGASSASDVIRLEGIQSAKNNLSIFRDTNKKLITLFPGWNGFRLTGTSGSFEIKFKFRFHTL